MRGSLQLLFFLAGPLLAHSGPGHTETCGLEGYSVWLEWPVCVTDPQHLCQDGDCSAPREHAWTHSSPCLQGTGSDHQICVFTDTAFANGRGISLVTTPQRANYLATAPAFVEPDVVKGLNQDLNRTVPAKYEMREFPGKGMGLVATTYIHRGDLIMANTASLMIDYRAFDELTKPQYTALQSHAVTNLPPPHRSRLLNLSSHTIPPEHLTRPQLIDTILTTNSFDIDPDHDDADQHHSFFVLFPEIARMNHDCRPNAEYLYDHGTLSQSIRAARDILPGEEVTLSYINTLLTRPQRQAKLKKNWGFDCSCAACKLEGVRADESDRRVEQIRFLKGEMRDWGGGSAACPAMGELLVALYEMERLRGSMYEAYTLAALEYSAAGDVWRAVKYARLGIEWGVPMVGEGDEDMLELRELSEHPWDHWSWERRVDEKGGEDGDGENGKREQKGDEKGQEEDTGALGYGTVQEILRKNLDKFIRS